MVDSRLNAANTDLPSFVARQRASGQSIEEAWVTLREVTGVPIALRTLYQWLKIEDEARAS